MTKHPVRVTRTMLCVATLASATALILEPEPVTVGVFAACLLVLAVDALRHAGKKIDRILAEETAEREQPTSQERPTRQRRAA